jgi:DNA-binding transcriptional ArsR family regulator
VKRLDLSEIRDYRISSIYEGTGTPARRITLDIRWTPKPEAADLLESELARLSKALGHPVRVRILREILTRDACTCGHLASTLPLAQSTISQHLKVLKEAALLELDASRRRPGTGSTARRSPDTAASWLP